jgi:CheY-like chemotaxis protein
MEGLGSLASGIAHDFNNILGIILGHISLIGRQRSDPEKFAQSKEAIEKAATRGASLVRQLLTFARKSDVIIQLISVNDLISELVKLFHETFPKLIEVVTDLDPKVPPLTADPTQLHQVFLNLCVNARDAMPQGGRLKITTTFWSGDSLRRLYPQAGSGEYVKIDVADTGEGMDEDTRKRIFEPFFTTKGVGKGTGLGLSTVFGIVESHHGFIDVESEVGKGTTFRIFFPVQRKTRETVDINKQVGEVTGGSETILFVEDEDALRELVKVVLITKGYTVLTANDGAEAINVYEKNHSEVKLVLTDLGLPILSGQEVVRKLNQINNSVKILIASGFLDPEVKSEMFKWGVKGFVQKPYQPDELLRTIRKVLDGS